METKKCYKCGNEKERESFSAERGRKDGLSSRCRDCNREKARAWKQANRARFAAGLIVVPSSKRCWRCRRIKKPNCFGVSRDHHDGLNPSCKRCSRKAIVPHNARRKLLGERERRGYSLWTVYRLRLADYDRIMERQGGKCGVCCQEFSRRPNVDHCHDTGVVRGILCNSCNALIAGVERPGFLEMALKYLNGNG